MRIIAAASRSFFGVDLAQSLTHTYVKKCSLFSYMDKRERRIVVGEWRPVSTRANSHTSEAISAQSSGHGGGLVNEMKIEVQTSLNSDADKQDVGSPVEELHHSVSSVSKVFLENTAGDAVNEPADLATNAEKHSVTMKVGSSLMRFIKGKRGVTQIKLEEELGVKIVFPLSKRDDCIVVEGDSAENVTKASQRIQSIVDEVVKSPNLDYSHFVSLPLAIYPGLVDKLINFQNAILGTTELVQEDKVESDSNEETSDEEVKEQNLDEAPLVAVQLKAEDNSQQVKVDITKIPLVSYAPKPSNSSASESKSSRLSDLGIEKSVFIKPRTFHLTVLMLKLWNKDRVKAASEVLQSVSSKVVDALDGRPVFIRLKGLQSMRTSLAKARVLYAPVEEVSDEGRLLRACQVITDAFVEAGLVLEKDARKKLLLHATIMNARHRKRKKGKIKVDSFDARGIMEKYGSEEWGEYLIREAHLSQMFVFDENGYYHCCASIPFPQNMQLD